MLRFSSLLSSSFLIATTVASAQSPEIDQDLGSEVERCHTFSDSSLRLGCYDDATGFEEESEQVTPPSSGGWEMVESRDDFTGSNTSYAILNSDQVGLQTRHVPVALVVRCDGSGGSDIYVVSGSYIGARNNRVPVRYRFSDSDPISENWSESTDGTAAFLPNGYRDFISGLTSGDSFVFEITNFRGTPASARFDGNGRGMENLELALAGCGAE